jgi:hypothetical protein
MIGTIRLPALLVVMAFALAGCASTTSPSNGGTGRVFSVDVTVWPRTTARVEVDDNSGLVADVQGFGPDNVKLTADQFARLADHHVIVMPIPSSSDFYVAWMTGICWPSQTVKVTGTAAHLVIRVDPGPQATGPCDLVGSGIQLRLTTSASVDLSAVDLTRADE